LLALTHQRAAALTYATTFLPHKERL
jgi:hypothetical protein